MRFSALTPHRGLLAAGAAAYSMSTLFSAMKPVLLTRFVQQDVYGELFSGLLVAMPFVGLACASLFYHVLVMRLSHKLMLAMFCLILVLSELASAYIYLSPIWVVLMQWFAGVSVGMLMGLISSQIARTTERDHIFGLVDMSAVLLMSFMISALGMAVGEAGIRGGFLLAAAISLLLGLVVLANGHATGGVERRVAAQPLPWSDRAVAVVVMGVVFVTTSGLGFAFMFTMAQRLGMDYALAGQLIGILLFISAFACWAGGACSARFGPYRPLAIAFVCCALGWYIAVHTTSAWWFMLALVPAIFALQFCFPVLLALSGSLDERGQWAAIATPLLTSGFAWAAITAGFIVDTWGLNQLATGTVVGMAICLALLWFVSLRSHSVLSR